MRNLNKEMKASLIYNDFDRNLLDYLIESLNNCNEFYFAVAFITKSGLVCLKNIFKQLENKGIKGKILTGDYLNFSEPEALKELLNYKNIEIKICSDNFHIKAYIFKNDNNYSCIIGSSNLTQNALKLNQEWNFNIITSKNSDIQKQVLKQFEKLWHNSNYIDLNWITKYKQKYQTIKKLITIEKTDNNFKPNSMQQEALIEIDKYIKKGASKVMVISSTGTGKTYLSAFVASKYNFKKILFIVHREQILTQALESYRKIFKDQYQMALLTGNQKNFNADFIFASMATISKDEYLNKFNPDEFEMICYDEAHKTAANNYKRIIEYFKPKLSFAMTATPIRTDGQDIFGLFDHNVAYQITLNKALENNLLCPFHYFGVSELFIDNKKHLYGDFNNINQNQRIEHILKTIKYYGYSGDKVHGLVFTKDKKEAEFLSQSFNQNGYKTIALTSESSKETREQAILKLSENNLNKDYLDYIFTVDIFNEGVDIPCINQIVMIRPTKSAIVFTQQLGRGLRKFKDKEYVVVIDFIGNYRNNYLIPIALSGDYSFNKDNLRKMLIRPTIFGCSTISFDKISKEQILNTIDSENFSELKKLLEAYYSLKNMLNRIPNYEDFSNFNILDILRIIENPNFNSYYEFLCLKDKEYKIRISKQAEIMLGYISKKFLSGKRIYEILFLKTLINGDDLNFFTKLLKKKYNTTLKDSTKKQLYLILSNNFNSTFKDKEKYNEAIFINKDFTLSKKFKSQLSDNNFKKILLDTLDESIRRYELNYKNKYLDTDFVLYQKYSYEDVCRLLNWDVNMVALNIGGYKYDSKTDTLPIFINYEKTYDSVYNNDFIDNGTIPFVSKANRDLDSKEIKQFKSCKNIFLFLRKNKNDKGAKEFYFLGKVNLIDLESINHKQKKYIKMYFKLKNYVPNNLYEYFINEL